MVTSQYRKTEKEAELWGNGEKWRCGVWRRGGRGPEIKWAGILDFARGEDLCYPSLDIDVMSEWLRLRLTGPASGSGQAAVILVQGPLSSPPPVVATSCHSTMATIFIWQRKRYIFSFWNETLYRLCRINAVMIWLNSNYKLIWKIYICILWIHLVKISQTEMHWILIMRDRGKLSFQVFFVLELEF